MNRFFSWLCLVCSGLLLIVSCEEPLITGSDILPSDDNLAAIYTDTITVESVTVREDSLRSDELSTTIIGSMSDADFGNSYASVFTQVLLPSNNLDLGTNPVLDSVVLTLDYDGSYGTTDLPQTFRVYEVTEDFYKDSTYYSNQLFLFDATLLGEKANHVPNLSDSVFALEGGRDAHLRIRLDDAFGSDLVAQSNQNTFSDDEAFLEYLKGFFVTVDSNLTPDGLVYFDLISSLSKLTLYYHTDDEDSLFVDFPINSDCARVSHYEHNYNGSTVQTMLNDGTDPDSLIFVQGMAGHRVHVIFPHITSLGDVLINKAELRLKVKPGTIDPFVAPDFIASSEADTFGTPTTVLSVAELDDENLEYIYNLPNYTQRLIQVTDTDFGFVLSALGGGVAGNRAILRGDQNLKLHLTYTQIQ